ncbi:hypothetical protein QR721_03610 [Aciduricibacillus chroicocephali]|uniref:Fido domain-containing protein n=1 Tax=Aciduricibacillus chroicocephali TaxID=3054939 RepID=A0ABY9KZA7_9BACI|nr:hypothetical protein QR721_03610 [Bacillaceae bacterium 44XB]
MLHAIFVTIHPFIDGNFVYQQY